MTLTLQPIEEKKIWEQFMAEQKPSTFLHSWAWGEFNKQMGIKIFRFGIYENNELKAVVLILKITAKRGSFLFCPHGPILKKETPSNDTAANSNHIKEMLVKITDHLQKIGREEKCAFIRISPLLPKNTENEKLFTDLKFREAPVHMMHPELGWILDVQPSEEELLKNMRKTTRYCIRKAEKDGVQIEISSTPADIEKFWQVYKATVDRQNFTPFSKEYLKREIEVFGNSARNGGASQNNNEIEQNATHNVAKNAAQNCEATFFFAKYNDEIIATAIIVFYQNSAFYHHGASIPKYPKITAPYLLQWAVIKEAKRRGCDVYNFWGVVPEELSKHPWAGLSLFKRGFGGSAHEYVHAKDLALNTKYWLNWSVEKVRKWKRGL